MNWFKKILKLCQKVNNRPLTYLDIGHSEYDTPEYKNNNILWVFYGGEILTEKESDITPTHSDAWDFISMSNSYYGRYDPSTDMLSINKPIVGVHAFRDIPSQLMFKLDRKFNSPIMKVF